MPDRDGVRTNWRPFCRDICRDILDEAQSGGVVGYVLFGFLVVTLIPLAVIIVPISIPLYLVGRGVLAALERLTR